MSDYRLVLPFNAHTRTVVLIRTRSTNATDPCFRKTQSLFIPTKYFISGKPRTFLDRTESTRGSRNLQVGVTAVNATTVVLFCGVGVGSTDFQFRYTDA